MARLFRSGMQVDLQEKLRETDDALRHARQLMREVEALLEARREAAIGVEEKWPLQLSPLEEAPEQ